MRLASDKVDKLFKMLTFADLVTPEKIRGCGVRGVGKASDVGPALEIAEADRNKVEAAAGRREDRSADNVSATVQRPCFSTSGYPGLCSDAQWAACQGIGEDSLKAVAAGERWLSCHDGAGS